MKIFAVVGENQQIVDETGVDAPEGWIQMLSERPADKSTLLYTATSKGTWEITQSTLNAVQAPIEDAWREEQMLRVANQLLMLEDEDPGAEKGTDRQWRNYRIELRKWTDSHPDFPDTSKRPVAPI